MHRWVVAFLSLHDGELRQTLVQADTKLSAYKAVLDKEFGRDYWVDYVEDTATPSDIEERVFDGDCFISAIKIPTWTSR